MKALVTGGTGFIGSHLVEELIRQGYSVTCLIRDKSNLQWIESYPINYIKVKDVGAGIGSLVDSLGDFDYVFHLAGLTKAGSAEDFFGTNVRGTGSILESLDKHNRNLRRFVHVSSLAAGGPCKGTTAVDTDMEPNPVSDYGYSKLEGERLVRQYMDRFPVTIIRPPAVYGPRDKDFYVVFKMIKKGFFPHLGKSYYSMIYVEDLVKGVIKSAKSDKTIGKTYYLTDRQVHTNVSIAEAIAQELRCRYVKIGIPKRVIPLVVSIYSRVFKNGIINPDKLKELKYTHWLCNDDEAAKDFGFQPKVKLKDGVKWTANWYRIHKWL